MEREVPEPSLTIEQVLRTVNDERAFYLAALQYLTEGGDVDDICNRISLPRLREVVRLHAYNPMATALLAAHAAERTRGHIHKGTPLYFLGMDAIISGDLDTGFMAMHQALTEDQLGHRTDLPETPALWFVTCEAEPDNQAFAEMVRRYADFIDKRLANYKPVRTRPFDRACLRDKVRSRTELLQPMFQLVFAVANIWKMEQGLTPNLARDNDFAYNLQGRLLFEVILVTDEVLRLRYPGEKMFLPMATSYASDTRLPLRRQDFYDANEAFKADFDGTMRRLLRGDYTVRYHRAREARLALLAAYGVRNRMAHGLRPDPVLSEQFLPMEDALFSAAFRAIETYEGPQWPTRPWQPHGLLSAPTRLPAGSSAGRATRTATATGRCSPSSPARKPSTAGGSGSG